MPAVALPAVLSAGFAYASGATILGLTVLSSALLTGGVSLALGLLSYAMTPKPKGRDNSGLTNQPGTVAVRQSDLTRAYVYGHTRAVKGYAHIVSTNSNKNLHMIIILAEGELRAINEIWVNDYCIPNDWIDADGNVIDGRYSGYMKIRKHLGSATQAADSVAVANIPEWTTNHRLRGTAYIYVELIKNQDVFPTGVPNFSAVVEGPSLYDPRIGANRWSTNIAQYCRDFIVTAKGFDANASSDVDDTNISAQMNICDEIVSVLDENFNVSSINTTTDIITLGGDLLTLQYGDQVQISSTGSLPSGLSAATNYYVIPYQILTLPRIKLAASLLDSMAGTAIDITSAGSGTITITKKGEPRYHGSGIADSNTNLSNTLNDLASSMAGRAICIGGAWTLLAGAYRTPAIEFTKDDLRSDGIGWENGLSLTDSFNIVNGLFRGPATLFQDTDYPSAKYDDFISDDYGVEAPKQLNLPFTTRPTTAQRIAKIELFRGRQDIAITCSLSTKALQVQPGDTVMITMDKYGWSSKIFEVTTFQFDANESGLICKLGLRETASAIYDWSMGEAITFDPAPNTTLSSPYEVEVPSGVSYNSRQVDTQGADYFFMLQLEWLPHEDGFVQQYGDFEVEYKLSSDSVYLPGGPPIPGSATRADVVSASAGTLYDLRIRARNSLGRRSNWAYIFEAVVGSSGGVIFTEDYGNVADSPSSTIDYGNVADSPSSSIDRGYV